MITRHPDLERLVAGELHGRHLSRARSHLVACPACRRSYQSMIEAERFLAHGHVDAPSQPEYERMLAQLLPHAAAQAAPRRWALWAGMPAAAAAAAIAVFAILPNNNEEFRHKSGVSSTADGVRAFCQRESHTVFATESGLSCQRGSSVVVAVRSAHQERLRAFFWLRDVAEQLHKPPRLRAVGEEVLPGTDEQVLSASIDIDSSVALGAAELHVVLCQSCTLDQAMFAADKGVVVEQRRFSILVTEEQP